MNKQKLINWLELGAVGEYTVFQLFELYVGIEFKEFEKIVYDWAAKKRKID